VIELAGGKKEMGRQASTSAGRIAGGPADMTTDWSSKSRGSASPPFGGFALSSVHWRYMIGTVPRPARLVSA
jgi:hypothetical protein